MLRKFLRDAKEISLASRRGAVTASEKLELDNIVTVCELHRRCPRDLRLTVDHGRAVDPTVVYSAQWLAKEMGMVMDDGVAMAMEIVGAVVFGHDF